MQISNNIQYDVDRYEQIHPINLHNDLLLNHNKSTNTYNKT